jgi:hypothetical protein
VASGLSDGRHSGGDWLCLEWEFNDAPDENNLWRDNKRLDR